MDKKLKEAASAYRDKLKSLYRSEPIAQRCYDMATTLGLSENDAAVMVAVHALECLKATQLDLADAKMALPPDAFYIREEDGTRKLVRYIGPTLAELRAERDAKPTLGPEESADPLNENYIGHDRAHKLGLAECCCDRDVLYCPFHGR